MSQTDKGQMLRFTCSRGDGFFKLVQVFLVDLSSLASSGAGPDGLLDDLVQFYMEEVAKQPTVEVTEQRRLPPPPNPGDPAMNSCARSTGTGTALVWSKGRRGRIEVESVVLVGLHGPSGQYGHIITVTLDRHIFDRYKPFAAAIFQGIHNTGVKGDARWWQSMRDPFDGRGGGGRVGGVTGDLIDIAADPFD